MLGLFRSHLVLFSDLLRFVRFCLAPPRGACSPVFCRLTVSHLSSSPGGVVSSFPFLLAVPLDSSRVFSSIGRLTFYRARLLLRHSPLLILLCILARLIRSCTIRWERYYLVFTLSPVYSSFSPSSVILSYFSPSQFRRSSSCLLASISHISTY